MDGIIKRMAVLAVHVDDCPGIASSDRLINYIKAGIETQYKVTHAPWKKVLGFKFECTESTVTMSAMHTIGQAIVGKKRILSIGSI